MLSVIKRKRLQLQRSGILLHHDAAPSDSSRVGLDTAKKLVIELLLYLLYSPGLAIFDYWLFLDLKNRLHGQKYEFQEELMCAVNRLLWEMSRYGL